MRLPDAYFEADMRIVDAADVLLVVWDGKPESGLGGTAQLVGFARARRLPIIWIHKDTCAVQREHFPTSWPSSDAKLRWLERSGLVRLTAGVPEADTCAESTAVKDGLSALARRNANWFRHAIGWGAGLGVAAALFGVAGGLLPHDTEAQWLAGVAVGVVEFLLLAGVLIFKGNEHRKQVRDAWIDARFAADLYRGIACSQPLLDPLRPAVAFLRPEWRRFSLTLSLRLHAEKAADFTLDGFRDDYAAKRLKNQHAFFSKGGQESQRWARMWACMGDWGIWGSVVFLTLALVNRVGGFQWQVEAWGLVLVGILPVLLPLIATASSSLALLFDHERRAGRYPLVAERLVQLDRELPHLHTEGSLREVVEATEEMLLDELLEWYSVTSRADPG
jgi:hypothetical protein